MCEVKQTYQVAGMTGDSCATRVTSEVSRIAGVTSTEVNTQAGLLTVAGHVDRDVVSKAVVDAGFQLASA